MAVKPVPDSYHTLTPYLLVTNVSRLIEFLKQAFDATERHRTQLPDGRVMHAEVMVGNSPVMMGEPPANFTPVPAALYMYVPDVDAVYARALAAGGTSMSEPLDQFYGDRMAGVTDMCGNIWWIASRKEELSPVEIKTAATPSCNSGNVE